MPFDDFIDIRDDDLTLADLTKIDKQAEKAEKRLEKLKKKGGIFAEATSNTATPNRAPVDFIGSEKLSKQDRKIDKKFARLQKKVDKDFVKQFGENKDGILNQLFGEDIKKGLFDFGRNPVGFLQNALIGAAGAGFALQVADAVIKEIQRLDQFFKVFIDRVDERNNQLRSAETQARIAAGLDQQIITTAAGVTEAREAYNTFNEFNNNRSKLEEDFTIRNTSGYE